MEKTDKNAENNERVEGFLNLKWNFMHPQSNIKHDESKEIVKLEKKNVCLEIFLFLICKMQF